MPVPTPSPLLARFGEQCVERGSGVTDLRILLWVTDPGVTWGAVLQRGSERPWIVSKGEHASLEEARVALRRVISHAQEVAPNSDVVVTYAGNRTAWASLDLKLPTGVRLLDPLEGSGTRKQAVLAQLACPGVITGRKVTIATDGSVSLMNSHAGYGWVASTGAFGLGQLGRHRDVCSAELAAIQSASRMLAPRVKGRMLVDSAEAITLVERMLSNGLHSVFTKDRRHARLAQIDRSEIRSVELVKVQAHSGNVLNEGADRLARLARRASEAGMSEDKMWRVARQIRDEVIADYRVSGLWSHRT